MNASPLDVIAAVCFLMAALIRLDDLTSRLLKSEAWLSAKFGPGLHDRLIALVVEFTIVALLLAGAAAVLFI